LNFKNLKSDADYKKLRLNNLNTPEFSHLFLLLYWPLYGLVFMTFERILDLEFHPVRSFVDDIIPFCEYFVIPYYFWFVFLIGMLLYSLLYNIDTYKKYMWYIIMTYSLTMVIYFVYPTSQELRPTVFERDNVFTHIVSWLYGFDTNTNVCPSIHVIGSFAVLFSAWHDKYLSTAKIRISFVIITLLICASTVFLKQHSIIDVVAGVALCIVCYPFVFGKKPLLGKLVTDNRELQ